MTKWLILFLLPLCLSLALSRIVILYLGGRLLDTPNMRSSHEEPTPRGGGIAILISTLITTIIAVILGYLEERIVFWLIIPISLISLLGICDDFFNLSVKLRLLTQISIATFAVLFLIITEQSWKYPSAQDYIMILAMILFSTWMTNLYNFMDGINGLAALEAISVCMGMIFIYTFQDMHQDSTYIMFIVMACAFGFLFWNFPNAKLFMGDSGSLLLGLSFGLLVIEHSRENYSLTAAWMIMLAVFIVDASYTLFHRIISRQAFSQGHRSHAYQKCARIYKSHTSITLTIVAINSLWLFPLAVATSANILNPLIGLLIAYGPLIFIARKYNAGHPD
ncbi:glycosyltransferase family 4 protein [Cellvibrio sp. pealriver]|uniref:MraY family glycosyltransferase n=1 Tax=Cellvibrio sp. pealriver TaxID=1622269 RepID=UPI00066FC954|nr:glycosyltransferase family 4 protein [Cellvibrio sp. pealriver]